MTKKLAKKIYEAFMEVNEQLDMGDIEEMVEIPSDDFNVSVYAIFIERTTYIAYIFDNDQIIVTAEKI